jgi:hypothetical protein
MHAATARQSSHQPRLTRTERRSDRPLTLRDKMLALAEHALQRIVPAFCRWSALFSAPCRCVAS